jgi:N-acyl-D-aspartate/D-glutamate deacylase
MFDILITNAKIVDGTGTPWTMGNIAISNGRIEAIGPDVHGQAETQMDATGKIVTPGFIDIHAHSDFSVLLDPRAESKVRQGVTMDISGNCGNSAAPLLNDDAIDYGKTKVKGTDVPLDWTSFGEYLARIEKQGVALNFGSFVGHHQVRMSVMGYRDGPPTPAELDRMKHLVKSSIQEGAVGMSSGLDDGLIPGCFADIKEIIELCKVAREANPNAVYTSHMRNRQEHVIMAVEEFIQVLRESGIRGQLSHVTPRFPDGDKLEQVMEKIENARAEGIDILCDVVGPAGKDYHTGAGILYTQIMPLWALNCGTRQSIAYLKDPAKRQEMKRTHKPLWGVVREGHWDALIVTYAKNRKDVEGRTVAEIAEKEGKDPWEAAYDILAAEEEGFKEVRVISTKHTAECDTRRALLYPIVMLESDRATSADYPPLNKFDLRPNSYDVFPRFIQRYVRDEKVLSLEDAIKRITFMPAKRLGLSNRGMIGTGFAADIVVFSLENLKAEATFKNPVVYPKGIDCVIVNGKVVVRNDKHTGLLPGSVIRLQH